MQIKILYVEDEPFLAQIVQESLQSRGFEVLLISDGSKATQNLEQFKPNICVLDIMLPGKNGYEIAKEIRQMDASLPIIFLTAKSQTEDLLKGFEVGGNDFLRKPFSMEELIVRINNLLTLSNSKTGQGSKINKLEILLGDMIFKPYSYELHMGSLVKKLSYKENTLLLILAENKNQAVERKDILMKLWGDDSFYNSRNLDVYIKKLREHLKADSQVEIVTIKGIGYHLVVK